MFSSAALSTLLSVTSKGFELYQNKHDLLVEIKDSDEVKSVLELHKKYLAKVKIRKKESTQASSSDAQESEVTFLPPIFIKAEGEVKPGSTVVFHPFLPSDIMENFDVSALDTLEQDNPDLQKYKEAMSEAINKLYSFYRERIKAPSHLKSLLHGRDESAYVSSDTESTVYAYLLEFLSKYFINFEGEKNTVLCVIKVKTFIKKYLELHKKKTDLVAHLTPVCISLEKALVHLKDHAIFLEFEFRVKRLLNFSGCAAHKMIVNLAMLVQRSPDQSIILADLTEEKSAQHEKLFVKDAQLLGFIVQCAQYYKGLKSTAVVFGFKKTAEKKMAHIFGSAQNYLTALPGDNVDTILDMLDHCFSLTLQLISTRDFAQQLWNDRTRLVMQFKENFPHLARPFQILEKVNKDISEHKMALLLTLRAINHKYVQAEMISPGSFGEDTEEIVRFIENNMIESLNSIINKYAVNPGVRIMTEITPHAKALVDFANQIALMHQIKLDEPAKTMLPVSNYSPRQFKSVSANSVETASSDQQPDERAGLFYV